MNKHIELVKKWLDNRDSVTADELRLNADAAYAAYAAADDAYAAAALAAEYAAAAAALAADYAGYPAYYAARAADYAADAAKYVKRYEELTGGEI